MRNPYAIGLTWMVLGLLAIPAAAQTPDSTPPPARPITLDQALAMARRQAPANRQAEGALRNERAQLRAAWAAFLPSVSLSAGAARNFGVERGGTRIENGTVVTLPSTPWSYSAGIGGNVELFGGGRRLFEVRQARAGLVSAEAGAEAGRFDVDLAVKRQYYDVLAARESEAAALAQVEQAEQQLRASVLRLRAASATKSDSLRSEIQLRNARLAVQQARDDRANAEASLSRAIGSPERVTAAEDDSLAAVAIPDGDLAALAEQGPAVRQARAELNAARAVRSTTWADYLPSLNASYNRGGSGSGSDVLFGADDLSYNGSLRLSLSLPLFNQLSREQQAVQRDVAADNAAVALDDARQAAREALTRDLGALRTATLRVEAQQASLEAAQEDLRVQQRRYAIGESTLLDVLTSQTQLNDVRAALIRARYDLRIARAELDALLGRGE